MFTYKDRVILTLASGSGGKGCLSFFRTKKNPRGGPDGGDGGQGGHLILKASQQVKDLEHLQGVNRLAAKNGEPGQKQKKSGKDGESLTVAIPVGTVVRNLQEDVLLDFKTAEEKIFLKGGMGAKGNVFFKNSRNQAPKQTQKGRKGEEQKVILEFKPMIDVALIGEVNSGKSTFFNQATNANSKVGDYPYTTVLPFIGQMNYSNRKVFLIDVPGLEAGAHRREAQGLSFLRSIQRARVLLHFIACNHMDPIASKNKIEQELKDFDLKVKDSFFEPLLKKTRFIVLSCADTVDESTLKNLKEQIEGDCFIISSHKDQGVKELLEAIEQKI